MEELGWIWLQQALGICSQGVNRLWESGISPEDLMGFSQSQMRETGLFTSKQIQSLFETDAGKAQKILDECRQRGYKILTPAHPLYPERLRQIDTMPAVLYYEGSWEDIEDVPTLAMVGTRSASAEGSRIAWEFAARLTLSGFLVVSGMAVGIDSQSHWGALEAGGRTIAVLGCGLDRNYPAANAGLREAIVKNGAVVTEYPPGSEPAGYHFPIRNRVISGLSHGVFVVEGGLRSGSLITAGHAMAQNRDAFAAPWSISHKKGAGCLRLIQDGAKLVMQPEDLLEEYRGLFGSRLLDEAPSLPERREGPRVSSCSGKREESHASFRPGKREGPRTSSRPGKREEPRASSPVGETRREPPSYLTEEQRKIYNMLSEQKVTSEYIVGKTGYTISVVLSALTELEIYGLLKSYPGNLFSL